MYVKEGRGKDGRNGKGWEEWERKGEGPTFIFCPGPLSA